MSRPTCADPSGRAYLDLQNRARREGRSTQELLTLYALERFLARLAMSRHAGTFVLKGGMLLAALNARRATVDADLLATDLDNQEAAVLQRIVEIASLVPEVDDGVRFSAQAAKARITREAALYAGVRVTMDARVSSATVSCSGLDREHLCVGMTRGREANHVQLTTGPADDDLAHRPQPADPTPSSPRSSRRPDVPSRSSGRSIEM
jgi:hypothetical protein